MSLLTRIKKLEETAKGIGIVAYSSSDDELKPCSMMINDKICKPLTIDEYYKDREIRKSQGWIVIDLFIIDLIIKEQDGLFQFTEKYPKCR